MPYEFRVTDHGSHTGTTCNDDRWGGTPGATWILDGATGLAKERLLDDGASDAQWFVTSVDGHLATADWTDGATTALPSAIAATTRAFKSKLAPSRSDDELWPFASFASVSVQRGTITLSNLGDCRILYRRRDTGAVASFGSSYVTELDANVVREMKRQRRDGVSDPDAIWAHIVPLIMANRRLKNVEGGYWILDMTERWLSHIQTRQMPAADVGCILLCTDGFYRLVDTYLQHDDAGLLDAVIRDGVEVMIDQVRTIERGDDRCEAYPRIKSSDDATAVLLSVVET